MSLAKLMVYGLFALVIFSGIVATVWTLIPDPNAATNFLGTKTHCPFVPYSTYGAVAVALVGTVIFLVVRRFWR